MTTSEKLSAKNQSGHRNDSLMNHPLFTHTMLLQTPPIDELFLIVKQVVLLRETGCVFTAQSGIGKSDGIERCMALLNAQFPHLRMYKHEAHNQQIPSIRAFFKHFLKTLGRKGEQKGETFDLRARVVNMLTDNARVSGLGLIVLFIDEANAMLLQDFLFLKDVFNDLAREDVQLVTILMGQAPDLENVIDDLKIQGRNDLIGRFAMRIHRMRGYNSLDDFRSIFRAIDSRKMPDNSQIFWTEFFVPDAWKSGFRLESEASNAFSALIETVAGIPANQAVFPARPTFLAIRYFLMRVADFDAESMTLPDCLWKEAFNYAMMQECAHKSSKRKKQPRMPAEAGS